MRTSRSLLRAARAASLAILAVLCGLASAAGAKPAPSPDSLLARARARIARETIDDRRMALEDLRACTLLAPERVDCWLEMGRLRMKMQQPGEARRAFAHAAAIDSTAPEPYLELANASRWDWLENLADSTFLNAEDALRHAARLAPDRAEPWIGLSALALARGDSRVAAGAAMRAQNADPHSAAAVLAVACAAYRLGRLALADSLFEDARVRLPAPLAHRFDDIGLFGGRASVDSSDGATVAREFWADLDPDLTSPASDLRLACLTRLGLAILLFRDMQGEVVWDVRAELLERYGLPQKVVKNRPTSGELQSKGLRQTESTAAIDGKPSWEFPAYPFFGYPFNEQVWYYPALGFQAVLWDRSLTNHYLLPASEDVDQDPRPSPAVLAAHPDLVAVGNGVAVFPALPPGVHRRALDVRLARFPAAAGTRVVAYLRTPGSPADTLRGRWVVLDAARRRVAADQASLGVSACDPTGARALEFAAELPPGDYRAGFAVDDARGGRGLATVPLHVGPPARGLTVSDVVLVCGDVLTRVADRAVRIEPRTATIAPGGTLDAYCEISGLADDSTRTTPLTLTWRVRARGTPDGGAGKVVLEATREESQVGPLRRQFLHVPLAGLGPGSWTLEVLVKDRTSGAEALGSAGFETSAPATATSAER